MVVGPAMFVLVSQEKERVTDRQIGREGGLSGFPPKKDLGGGGGDRQSQIKLVGKNRHRRMLLNRRSCHRLNMHKHELPKLVCDIICRMNC